MNTIVIAIKINERQIIVGAQWPTKATLKGVARLKLAGLKRKAQQIVLNVAMVIIPIPKCAAT